MEGYYFLTIPVKKHIEKFMASTEGPHIVIKKNNFIWTLIRPYIVYRINSGHTSHDINSSYPGKLKIRLPKSKMRNYGLQPRDGSVIFIHNVLNSIFSIELSIYVQSYLKQDGRYKGYNAAITDFCKFHNIIIDEDISIDNLQKLEFRFRQRKKKFVPYLS